MPISNYLIAYGNLRTEPWKGGRRHVGATSERLGASSGPLRGVLGRLGSVLGASWGHLGSVLGRLERQNRLGAVLEPFWSRPGSVLETSWGRLGPSWRRLGDVLGRLGSVLGASCGPLRGFLDRLVWLLERLGASWRHLCVIFLPRSGYM